MESGLYFGTLRHRRFHPKPHDFAYPLFMAYLEIDKIPELMQRSKLSSYNRWNWASFHEADHFGDPSLSLRRRLELGAVEQNMVLPTGRIFLLTHLRYLGYNFNPVSFFYCFDPAGSLQMVVAEVSNTFAETHNYWLNAEPAPNEKARHFKFRKQLHVSPFMRMNCLYEWTFTLPNQSLVVQSNQTEEGKAVFDSTLRLEFREWTTGNLRRALFRYPWMTAKVITAIHWQAVQLFLRGVPVVRHPGPGHFQPNATRHFGASWKTS